MTLIKSISGIRGTIGGDPGDGLTPLDIVKFASAYAAGGNGPQDYVPMLPVYIGRMNDTDLQPVEIEPKD